MPGLDTLQTTFIVTCRLAYSEQAFRGLSAADLNLATKRHHVGSLG